MDDDGMEENTRPYPAPASLAISPPSEAFRAPLRSIAESFDLGELELEVDASWAVYSLIDVGIGYLNDDELEQDWRFIYEWYMDLGWAFGELFAGKALRGLAIETFIWEGMGPWLAGQIRGRGAVVNPYRLPRFQRSLDAAFVWIG